MSLIALPDRPLKLSSSARPAYVGSLFFAFVLMVIGVALLVFQLPSLQHDWTISRNPVMVTDGNVQDGRCTTRKAIFTDCEAHLFYAVDGKQYDTEVSLMFVDFHTGDYMVEIVRSGDDPSLATMNIGIDKLWNRVILLAVLVLFSIGGGLLLLWQGAKAMRAAGQLVRRGKMTAVPVAIVAAQAAGRSTKFTISDPAGKRPKARHISTFKKGDEPLILQSAQVGAFGVAVKHEASDVPVLLDRGLTRLDLTAEERAAALASIPA